MISPFRKPKISSALACSTKRFLLAVLPVLSLHGCAVAAQLPTLQPVSVLVTHIMARAIAVDTLISRVQQRLDTPPHPLHKEVVSVGGLGPIRLGMTVQEAANAAQVSFVVSPTTQSEVCQYYLPEVYDPDKAAPTAPIDGVGLMVVNDQVIRIDIWPGSPIQTLSGLGIGATVEDVEVAYDEQLEVTPHPYTDGSYLTLTPDASGSNLYSLVFEADGEGKITQFRTGQLPAVTWAEGCS